MKKVFYIFILLLLSASSFSQAPQGISYQAVVRNAGNALVANSPVSAFITIQKDSANGSLVYGEIDNATTNANGLFSVVIGKGQSQIGSLSNINWGSGVYYIRSAIDPSGGTNRTITGSSQILSVPYALYAANGTANGNKVGDMQYWDGTKWTLISAGTNGSVLTLCNGLPTWGGCGVVALLPTVTTSAAGSVTSTAATLGGNVTADGGATVTSRGFCYSSTVTNPTLANSTVAVGSGTGVYSNILSGLTSSTTYYVTAYATNSVGTSYGTPVNFTTSSNGLATIATAPASTITSNSAILGGNITADGGYTIISRGVCYSSTVANPTLANSSSIAVGSGTGSYSTLISNITSSTTYYVAAYATNSLGITTYGTPISFSTGVSIVVPTVATSSASSITSNGATLGGNVTADGGTIVTGRGFCYSSTTQSPTLVNSTVAVGSGTGVYGATLSGLVSSTTYYVIAYATNIVGTSYGTPVSFTTASNGLATIATSSASTITSNSAVLGGNITSDGGNTIISRGICYSSTVANPTLANSSSIAVGSGTGSYSTLISGITSSTTYYVAAYATNSLGITTYGTPISFSTNGSVSLPTVTSSAASSVSANGATFNGNVTATGSSSVVNRGFCYSNTTANPTLANSSVVGVGNGNGAFSTSLSSLATGTTYYVTAYATNSAGTTYSTPNSFTTSNSNITYTIGQSYGGGIIFYLDASRQHGFIASNNDAGGMTPWDKSVSGTFATTNATDTSVGSGSANTTAIIATIGSVGSYAAYIASQTSNGYSDWYLPSKYELELMFSNLWTKSLGNFTANLYWTSSEFNNTQAWAQQFNQNTYINTYSSWKSNSAYIRPIRKF